MNDKQALEHAIENAQEVVNRLKEQHSEQYGYSYQDLDDLLQYIKRSKENGLTKYEIKRKSRVYAAMMEDKIDDALNELLGSGEVLLVKKINISGRRPRLAYVYKEFANT